MMLFMRFACFSNLPKQAETLHRLFKSQPLTPNIVERVVISAWHIRSPNLFNRHLHTERRVEVVLNRRANPIAQGLHIVQRIGHKPIANQAFLSI